MARPKKEDDHRLTESEIKIMNFLWEIGESSVQDVLEHLKSTENKEYAYTTVSTLIRILEKKEVVGSRKKGRGHRYFPLVAKGEYQEKEAHRLVADLFSGSPTALIRRLLGSEDISSEEIAEVKKLIDQKAIK
ncbi:MAG: BlaI/MecI/CopY family transcriptional regulator [Bdellovibrionales bacterium]|nr:BlaI/MecI/CopY family transcriptional regulator [Bdellovibrionales bacterium]